MTRPDPRTLLVAGREIPLLVRRHRQARRIVLRIDLESDGVSLTLPRRAALDEGLALARDRADWILKCLAKLPPRVRFQPGARMPLMGDEVTLRHDPHAHTPVRRVGDQVIVGGHIEHFTRRLTDWLKREVRQALAPRAHEMAERLGRQVARIAVRDTRSRWGSCAPSGNLSFCWRLAFAPAWVIDYVVAHEVAHLVHMNHSQRFWKTVDSLGVSTEDARSWLDDNAERLQRIG
jgi:predicted metal-dependent hydrolase